MLSKQAKYTCKALYIGLGLLVQTGTEKFPMHTAIVSTATADVLQQHQAPADIV